MSLIDSIKEAFTKKVENVDLTSGEFFLNLLIGIVIIIIGIFIGKIVKFGLRKIIEKIKLEKIINQSFINLFLSVVKWSVYILFLNFALMQLQLPLLTNWLITILSVIPSLTGALIIIIVGFGIASYLRKIIEDSKIGDWKMLSKIFFYFINYVFIIFALRTALISLQDALLANTLIIVITLLIGITIILGNLKKD